MSSVLNLLELVALPPPAAQCADEAEAIPLMRRPILTVHDFILGSLLGTAASCLALAAGMFLGLGETRLAICFATVTILIVLCIAAPGLVTRANSRPLLLSLAHRHLFGHPLIADYTKPVWLSDEARPEAWAFVEQREAERRNATLTMTDGCCDEEPPF